MTIYQIINTETNRVLEEHETEHAALRACNIVNDHEIKHNRTPRYKVEVLERKEPWE